MGAAQGHCDETCSPSQRSSLSAGLATFLEFVCLFNYLMNILQGIFYGPNALLGSGQFLSCLMALNVAHPFFWTLVSPSVKGEARTP